MLQTASYFVLEWVSSEVRRTLLSLLLSQMETARISQDLLQRLSHFWWIPGG